MSNDEIVKGINEQVYVAMALRMMALCFERFYGVENFTLYAQQRVAHLNKMAGLFTAHALRLIAAHKTAVEQWMEQRQASESRLRWL
jgi:hypothetical protein